MSPVPYTWGPFSAKIFLKIWFCKIDPLLPPHIDFNTIPYFTYGCPYRGVKEGKLKNFFFLFSPCFNAYFGIMRLLCGRIIAHNNLIIYYEIS